MEALATDPLDALIGANIRRLRLACGMTQGELGACLGVSFQQIQKYEKGANRIAASDLARLAVALACTLNEFFERTSVLPS